MNTLRKLFGRTALAAMAAGMLVASTTQAADSGSSSCPEGQYKCGPNICCPNASSCIDCNPTPGGFICCAPGASCDC